MAKYIDITGQRFERLTALEYAAYHRSGAVWRFRCDCGTIKEIAAGPVKKGVVKSCGCLHRERCRAGINQTKHGDARVGAVSRLHSLWRGMLKRAGPGHASKDTRYRDRGITVCPEWLDYSAFKAWAMVAGYADDLTLDRIDNDGNYEPSNCRWTGMREQARNRRSTRYITVGDETKTLVEWAEVSGLCPSTITTRLSRGWSAERAITTAGRQK